MILVKLGGSVITNKSRPLSARRKAIDRLAAGLAGIGEPVAVVHGGGSYGHYWSVKYDMHTKEEAYDAHGVSTVKNSMIHLDAIIVDSMLKCGLNPYSLPPTDFMAGGAPIPEKILELGRIADAGFVPVTYGDALWWGEKKTYILSGDRIMTYLAHTLRPRLCIFALNEDGLYADLESKRLIRQVGDEEATFAPSSMDVTGGMSRKVQEAARIAHDGTNVFLVNGNKPERIEEAVKNKRFEGTLFRGKRDV